VVFSWKPRQQSVLEIRELDLAEGEKLFVYGPSGSGKSSLLGLTGCMLKPDSGSIRILDQDILHLDAANRDRFRADHIGFVFQLFNLTPCLSVMENIHLPCAFSSRRKHRTSGRTVEEAHDLLNQLGLSADRYADRPVTELSIGEQQRVALARALIGSPELLLADEPTSALDEASRENFLHLLMEQCRRTRASLILVSHDLQLARHFDRQFDLRTHNSAWRDEPTC